MEKITLVKTGDWIGVYIGDNIKLQNHTLRVEDILTTLQIPFEVIELRDFEGGLLPSFLKDLNKDDYE